MSEKESRNGSLIGGLILIILGILFLFENLDILDFSEAWPLILVIIGVGLIVKSFAGSKQKKDQSSLSSE